MSGKTAIVFTCAHATPECSNERFDWLGKLIYDIQPDYVVDLGDGADMASLSSHDTKSPKQLVTQNYERDIEVYNDAQERLRHKFKHNKKRLPRWYGLEGNHCVPDYTDVLVWQKGWTNIKDVSVGDTVMSLEGWTKVHEVISTPYDGPLYKIGDQGVVQYVTEGHRVYYYNGGGRLDVKPVEDCPETMDIPVSVFFGDGVGLNDWQIKFNAIAMTDSYHKGSTLVFYQSGEKADVIESVIKNCGVYYRKAVRDREPTHICGKELKSVQIGYEFHMKRPDWCVSDNKSVPDWMYRLSERQFDVALEMLVFCDGSVPTRATTSRVFYGMYQICSELQAVLVTKGYRATLTEYRPDQWRVNIYKTFKCRATKKEVGSFSGVVWCLSTESKSFLMRQYGKPSFTGNCNRIKKALAFDPRLEGAKYGVSFKHLQTDYWFDEYTEYAHSAPGIAVYDGVSYAHYIGAGNYGTAMSGIHHAYALLAKRHCSTTVGHSHKRSIYFKDDARPYPSIGLVAGCYKGREDHWAGQSQGDWWKGVVVKRSIENGHYEPEFISQNRLREVYGKAT